MQLSLNSLLNEYGIKDRLQMYFHNDEDNLLYINTMYSDLMIFIMGLHVFFMDSKYNDVDDLLFETFYEEKFNTILPDIIKIFYYLTNKRIKITIVKKSIHEPYINPLVYPKWHHILFSGGLDSFCGALFVSDNYTPLLIHIITSNRILNIVKNLHSKSKLNKFPLLYIDARTKATHGDPSFTRGLLFLTCAYAISSHYGSNNFYFSENGSQMLDVMLTSIAYPNKPANKNTNPIFLNMCEKLFSIFNGKKFNIIKNFNDNTKSELITKYKNDMPINLTHSCFRTQGISKMCGMCYNCFLRKMSLMAINIIERDKYENDPFLKIYTDSDVYYERQRIIFQVLRFYNKILLNDRVALQEIILSSKGFFKDPIKLSKNFALDIYLGIKNDLNLKNQEELSGLAMKAKELLSNVDSSLIEDRKRELLQIQG